MLELILLISTLSLGLSIYTLLRLRPTTVKQKNSVLLDTSALIDGRISEVVKSGFVPSQLLVPKFVIAELQLLADKADHTKRERARFGLSVIQDLQASRDVNIAIISEDIPEESGVDEKLVKLALKRGSLLFTTDFNLLKVAEISGVRVLNINELSQNLRPTRLPGEQAVIKIVGRGQERTQGVGYLDDGTLVVVEKAGSHQGKEVHVEFTRNLQTSAGRMMFAKMLGSPASDSRPKANVSTDKSVSPKPRTSTQHRRRPKSAEDRLLETIAQQK